MLDLERKDDQRHNFNGDEIRVRMPPAPPSRQMLHGGYDTGIRLLDPVQTSGESLPQPPPLLERIPPQGGLSLKHISATQFADLGGYQRSGGKEREDYRKRLLSSDAGDDRAAAPDSGSIGRRTLSARSRGAIVHDLLRFGDYEATGAMIRSLAWQRGLTADRNLDLAVDEVKRLLSDFRQSKVFRWIKSARAERRPVHTELPFVYRANGRIIHGVMDLLLQQADGSWAIVDYKTTEIIGSPEIHVQRYYLQLAVYAAAAQAHLGLPDLPATYVHYLAESRTLSIERDNCLAALKELEASMGELEQFYA